MGGIVALIPARGASKRVPGKNIRELGGLPLIAHTIRAAIDSQHFAHILVSSDDVRTLEIAHQHGADVLKRPEALATDTSPDIGWVKHALTALGPVAEFEYFAILRPTSPFRTAQTICRAVDRWNGLSTNAYSSLRAVEQVSQHPGKMWTLRSGELVPLLMQPEGHPWHDSQYAALPRVYVQNASLEIAAVRTVMETGTISGNRIAPFLTEDYEGFDINSELDWLVAEVLDKTGKARLPGLPASNPN